MEWYVEFEIVGDRPGLLGSITTLTGLMGIGIVTINTIAGGRKGLLLACDSRGPVKSLQNALAGLTSIRLTAFKQPSFVDKIGLKHGKIIHRDPQAPRTYRFVREDLGMLVDFLGELIRKKSPIIGLRGMPRVGKTEATIAACVYANKKWVVISSTLMRQLMRKILSQDELSGDSVYLIDGIVSCVRGGLEHKELVRKIIKEPVPKVIEHPDIFLRENSLSDDFFDFIIELRRTPDEVIDYNMISQSFSAFDIS